jgi:hypothetical protein
LAPSLACGKALSGSSGQHLAARLAAGQLHVHPQTVRYRLRQIQDLFGPVLAEPGGRFELEVALRARGLLRARPVPPQPAPPGRHRQGGA